MNTLIMCEGASDAILLGYYLQRVSGWCFSEKAPKGLQIKVDKKNEFAGWYTRNDDWLMICGVGGNTCFGSFFEKRIKNPLIFQNAFSQMALVCDRDNSTNEEIAGSLLSAFNGSLNDLSDREWKNNTYLDSYGMKQSISVLLLTIPREKEGALESILMEAISENPYDKEIVLCCQMFVDRMTPIATKYLKSRRLQLKAKLSVIWAIQSPQKVFEFIDEQIKNVEWECSKVLKDCFEELLKI